MCECVVGDISGILLEPVGSGFYMGLVCLGSIICIVVYKTH